ncbi:MAG: hypothetical protein E7596_04080 [Ruminococcaceae bacterium]|nr:hypothetical protein [Oscillospiraceae bacterium]
MKIILDRIDKNQNGEKIATFEVDKETVSFTRDQMPSGFMEKLIPNAIVECEIASGNIVNPTILFDETKQKEEEMKNRLHSLFKRK